MDVSVLHPKSFLMIFFQGERHHIAEDGHPGPVWWPTRQGARPHPRVQVVAPLMYFFRSVFFIISKNNFRGVSGLLELCRIGL